LKILLIEDERITRVTLDEALRRASHTVVACDGGTEGLARFNEGGFDAVITDLRLPDLTGMDVLQAVKSKDPECVVLMMTAFGTVESAVEALKVGAYDYLTKPFSPEKLLNMLVKIGRFRQALAENALLRQRLQGLEDRSLVGNSAAMRALRNTIRIVAERDSTVLLQGESGSGKELVARALHAHSPRANGPFVPVNCAVIPETLLESELFGHEKGAFSGAIARHIGYFERAQGGTLFIDDIDDLPLQMQVKLLRTLQEREFQRVGGDAPVKIDVRIICATKGDLRELVRAGRFRDDLYYRLNIVLLRVPSLRERKEDIPVLVDHFLTKHSAPKVTRSRVPLHLPQLLAYDWPGNVRELENVVQRLAALPDLVELDLEGRGAPQPAPPAPRPRSDDGSVNYEAYLETVDRELITWALTQAGGNVTAAAKLLQLPRTTLRSKMEKYGVPVV
jgi:DNA-binding NtrC family response regulator